MLVKSDIACSKEIKASTFLNLREIVIPPNIGDNSFYVHVGHLITFFMKLK